MKQYQTDFTLDRKQRSLLFMSSVSGTRSNSGYHDTGGSEEKKSPNIPNRSRTYDVQVTSLDALPLSHRTLVGAIAEFCLIISEY